MRPLLISLGAVGFFLLAMTLPATVRAVIASRDAEDHTVREYLINRFYQGNDTAISLVLVLCAERVTPIEALWLRDHELALRGEATRRFEAAGMRALLVGCRELDFELALSMENSPIRADPRLSGTFGVVRVDFSEDTVAFDGVPVPAVAPWRALEHTNHGRVTILLGHLGSRFGSASCDETCAVVNLLCHGAGHAIGFDDPGHSVPYLPFSFSEFVRTWLMRQQPDVMMQAASFDSRPLGYNVNSVRNRRVIDRLKAR